MRSEAAQRAVGLLTACYTARDSTAEAFAELVGPVLKGFTAVDLRLQFSADADPQSVADTVVQAIMERLTPEFHEFVGTLVAAFICMANDYKADHPDTDVPRFLQNFALSQVADN